MAPDLTGKIKALAVLGDFLSQFTHETPVYSTGLEELNEKFSGRFIASMEQSSYENGWFTAASIREALLGITVLLNEENLITWTKSYPALLENTDKQLTIGVIMAGNIPAVGFHDFMAVLLSGNRLEAKTSSKDRLLIPLCAEILEEIEPGFRGRMHFTEDKLGKCDAVIATGSNNSSRYFEYYFSSVPHIIRNNRNSIAVLSGDESDEELNALGQDVFSFFGLGCRNVTKIYIPEAFPPEKLMAAFDHFFTLAQHHKYANNVDYHRSVFLMNAIPFLDNGCILLKEDPAISSPVGVVYYEKYHDIATLSAQLESQKDELQCVVSGIKELKGIPPGSSQLPMPWDYADGVDTLLFLTQLQKNDL